MSAALHAQKKALRTATLAVRKLIPPESVRLQSENIANALVEMPEFQASNSVSCFLSMDGEVDTSMIVDHILDKGKRLFVPRMEDPKSGKLQMLRVYSRDDLDSLPAGLWGIREPNVLQSNSDVPRENAQDSPDSLEFIVMPGVAFDRTFGRLGYGKGFYDRFLSTYTSGGSTPRQKPHLVAIALKEQLLPEGETVPTDSTDWFMDAIVSPAFVAGESQTLSPSLVRRRV
ncbi:5-formyltetrahydrofolate cyclo-ligase [Clavulina sp. PMI_390]|nr:5-formyltetrahydrofolate cyclo-ligase [Clavulina sp. PMI_390]